MNSVLILCPLPKELEILISNLRDRGLQVSESHFGKLRVFEVPELKWRLSLAGHGKVQFGIQTQFLISQLKALDAVIYAGAAGALESKLATHDVVIAEKTIEHDYTLKFGKRPHPEFPGDERLLKLFKNLRPDGYRIHFGVIVSGDEDVVDAQRAQELRTRFGALAVAWEGAGGARACQFNQIPFLEVRGLTDASNLNAVSDFNQNLKTAMSHVFEVLVGGLGRTRSL